MKAFSNGWLRGGCKPHWGRHCCCFAKCVWYTCQVTSYILIFMYLCHRSVLLFASVRETSFRSEWGLQQRLTIGLSAEKKWLLISKWDINITTFKAQGPSVRETGKNVSPPKGMESYGIQSPRQDMVLYCWTLSSCNYLHKTCSRLSPSAFHHGPWNGLQGAIAPWGSIWHLMVAGERSYIFSMV